MLAERLAARRPEIEQTVLTRVHAVGDPTPVADPEYALGLKAAVHAALSYGLSAIEDAESQPEPVPHELLSQARRAARSGVGLDTVLRRYVAGHTLLEDYFIQEAEGDDRLLGAPLQHLLRAEAVLFDRLIDVVATEYRDETAACSQSHHRRQAGCVEKLLAGELTDTGGLDYDLSAWHVGAVAMGSGAGATLRSLAKDLDRRLLCVPGAEGVLWAWLGSVRRPGAEELELPVSPDSARACIVTGEPAQGLPGWRLSHRQAVAALPVALRVQRGHVRYADVALLGLDAPRRSPAPVAHRSLPHSAFGGPRWG